MIGTPLTPAAVAQELAQLSAALDRNPEWDGEKLEWYFAALRTFPLEAVQFAKLELMRTWREKRFPPPAELVVGAAEWVKRHVPSDTMPRQASDLCPFCAARAGQWPNGRVAVLHERTCAQYNPDVTLLASGPAPDWRSLFAREEA